MGAYEACMGYAKAVSMLADSVGLNTRGALECMEGIEDY